MIKILDFIPFREINGSFLGWILNDQASYGGTFTFEPYISIALSIIYALAFVFALIQLSYHLLLNRYTRYKCGFRHFTRLGFCICLFARMTLIIITIFIPLNGLKTDTNPMNQVSNLKIHNHGEFRLNLLEENISWPTILTGAWPISQLPNTLITLSFIFCHIFLIFYWLSCYAKIRLKGKLHKNRFRFYCQILTVFFISGFILYSILIGLHFFPHGLETLMLHYKWIVFAGFFPFVTLVLSLGFSFFALKTFSELSSTIDQNSKEYRYLKRTGTIIIASLICLYFKSILMAIVLIPEILTLNGLISINSGLWQFIVLLFCECIPTIVTMLLFRSVSFTGIERINVQDPDSVEFIPREVSDNPLDLVLPDSDTDSTLFI